MSIATLVRISRLQNKSRCLSTDKLIKNVLLYIYTYICNRILFFWKISTANAHHSE